MKVLVTGGAGYIGSHTAKLLAASGHEPVVFDNLSTGHRSLAKFGPLVEGDIRDRKALITALETHQVEAVIHFAASAYVGESMNMPRAYYDNNVTGTLSLLDAMHDTGVTRLVFSSSCATYGIPDTVPISEQAPQDPINPYGRTKLIGEHMIQDAVRAENLNAICLRYFNASGADAAGEIGEMHDPETHLIPLVLMAIQSGKSGFKIMGDDYPTPDGTCIRDYLHVTDLASAHLMALNKLGDGISFDAFNLGTGAGYSVRDVIEAAKRVTGKALQYDIAPRRAGDPPALVANAEKAASELGWQPAHSDMDNIITTAWQWMHSANNAFYNQDQQARG